MRISRRGDIVLEEEKVPAIGQRPDVTTGKSPMVLPKLVDIPKVISYGFGITKPVTDSTIVPAARFY